MLALLALALPLAAFASPMPQQAQAERGLLLPTSLVCVGVKDVLDFLPVASVATSFCSSFLSIPTVTDIATAVYTAPTTLTVQTTAGTESLASTVISATTVFTTVSTCVPTTAPERKRQFSPWRPSTTDSTSRNSWTTPTHKSWATSSKSSSTTTASAWPTNDIPASLLSTACSCLGIATPTTITTLPVTVTPTVTLIQSDTATTTLAPTTTVSVATSTVVTTSCPAPTLCDNQGLQWAYYANVDGPNGDSTYSNFVPEQYKTQPPVVQGVTDSIGGIDLPGSGEVSVYGSPPEPATYFVLNHRGYIHAQQTGTYVFDFSGVDDAVYLWLGAVAYAGWAKADADVEVAYHQGPGVGSYSADLVAGAYYAVRIIFAQAQGAAVFQLAVSAPDGTVFLSGDTAGSPYLVQYSCDGLLAPPYAEPFGSEV